MPRYRTFEECIADVAAAHDPGACWRWPHSKANPNGYHQLHRLGRTVYVHRTAYEVLVGPIPEGLEIDHLCRNRWCCNPVHMEPVTHRENNRRSDSLSARNARMTHCREGHPLEGENLVKAMFARGVRRCRTCHNEWQRRNYRKRSAHRTP